VARVCSLTTFVYWFLAAGERLILYAILYG
jgi:hypothetical protein